MRERETENSSEDEDDVVADEDDVVSSSHSFEAMVMDFISSAVVRTSKRPPFPSICHSANGSAKLLAALCAINHGLRVMPLSYSSSITFSLAVVAIRSLSLSLTLSLSPSIYLCPFLRVSISLSSSVFLRRGVTIATAPRLAEFPGRFVG